MSTETKLSKRDMDTPRDKPVSERTEHANLERPAGQAHPRARVGWGHPGAAQAWRMR
jgi:hypothetical protein